MDSTSLGHDQAEGLGAQADTSALMLTTATESQASGSPDHESHESHDPNPAAAHVFRRAYKACDACRQRKVRCDLGSVENPVEPPCRRCRRERRECTFTKGLRGRGRTGPTTSSQSHISRTGPIGLYPSSERFPIAARSQQPLNGSSDTVHEHEHEHEHDDHHQYHHHHSRRIPSKDSEYEDRELSYAGHHHPTHPGENDRGTHTTSPTAHASLALVSLSSATEAIRVLAEQESTSPPSNNHSLPDRSDEDWDPEGGQPSRSTTQPEHPHNNHVSHLPPLKRARSQNGNPTAVPDPPASSRTSRKRLRPSPVGIPMVSPPRPSESMLQLWEQSTPVRSGMVTAGQAHYLVGYYFSHLHGFSSLCSEKFTRFHTDTAVCTELALDEALLLHAILAISSRYAQTSPNQPQHSTTGLDPPPSEQTEQQPGNGSPRASTTNRKQDTPTGDHLSLNSTENPITTTASSPFLDDPSSSGFERVTLQQHIDLSRKAYEISGHVLTDSTMHTIGTVEGLLILSEWGTWQMHDDPTPDKTSRPPPPNSDNDSSALRRTSHRYDSMVWLLVGCAVRLAEQLDLHKVEHVKCILDAPSAGQGRSSRPPPTPEQLEVAERRVQAWMSCVQIEASVSVRLGRRFTSSGLSPEWMELIRARTWLLPENPTTTQPSNSLPSESPTSPAHAAARAEEAEVDRVRSQMVQSNINLAFPDDLVGSAAAHDSELNEYRKWVAWRGHAELAAKMRRTYELLYESESRSHNMIENDSFEGFLRPLRADLDHWVQWLEPKIGYPGGGMRTYNIRIQYHFTRLVLFRIGLDALVTRASKGTLDLRDGTGITDRAAYPMAKEAVDAARTLAIIISVDLASLRCAPPRIFLYLVLSVLLCMQAAELSDALMQPLQCASILRHAITALLTVSLDGRHLSRVYAILLRKVGATVLKHEEHLGQHHTRPPYSDPALVQKLNEARSRNMSHRTHRPNSAVLRPRGHLHPAPRPQKKSRRNEHEPSGTPSVSSAALPPTRPAPFDPIRSPEHVMRQPASLALDSIPLPGTAHVFPASSTAVAQAPPTQAPAPQATHQPTQHPLWPPASHQSQQHRSSGQPTSQLPSTSATQPSSSLRSTLPHFGFPEDVLGTSASMMPGAPSPASASATGGPSPAGTDPSFQSLYPGALGAFPMHAPPSFAGDIVPNVPRMEDIWSFFGSVDETFNLNLPPDQRNPEGSAVAQATDAGTLLGLSDADAARLAMVGDDQGLNWPLLLNLNPALQNNN